MPLQRVVSGARPAPTGRAPTSECAAAQPASAGTPRAGVPGLGGRYDRVRIGDLDEDQLPAFVASTSHLRRDVIPAAAPTVVDASTVQADKPAGTSVPTQKTTRRRKSA